MARSWDHLTDELAAFCDRQHVFFVATAPDEGGHVNLSPKGYESFRVLDSRTVAYVDLTGSGVETIAHLRSNGRITVMFTAFEGPPNIVRIYGAGEVLMAGSNEFAALKSRFPDFRGARAIIRIAVQRVSSSCGYAVPFMDYRGERPRLEEWAAGKSDEELADYQLRNNALSIDGLPGLYD